MVATLQRGQYTRSAMRSSVRCSVSVSRRSSSSSDRMRFSAWQCQSDAQQIV